jgi:hypothetical protein
VQRGSRKNSSILFLFPIKIQALLYYGKNLQGPQEWVLSNMTDLETNFPNQKNFPILIK